MIEMQGVNYCSLWIMCLILVLHRKWSIFKYPEMYESIQIPNQFRFNSAFFVSFELNLKQKKLRWIEFELNLVSVELNLNRIQALWSRSELNLNRIVKNPGQSKSIWSIKNLRALICHSGAPIRITIQWSRTKTIIAIGQTVFQSIFSWTSNLNQNFGLGVTKHNLRRAFRWNYGKR